MVRTINVVYTTRRLSGSEASKLKAYMFLCSYDQVKVGDLIESPMYTTSMQVIGVSNYAAKEQNGITNQTKWKRNQYSAALLRNINHSSSLKKKSH